MGGGGWREKEKQRYNALGLTLKHIGGHTYFGWRGGAIQYILFRKYLYTLE